MAGKPRPVDTFTWAALIRRYFDDKTGYGDITSDATRRQYRVTLEMLSEDVHDLDPRHVDRDDIKRALRRWPNANTRSVRRAILVSFFDWMVEEGMRDFNPVRQTRKVRRRQPEVIRWTLDEARSFLAAAESTRELRVSVLGVCMGLRLGEILSLRGEDFARPGFVRVRGKGNKQRWLPLTVDAIAVGAEIRANVALDEYVIPAERWRNPNVVPRTKQELKLRPASRQAVRTVVIELSARAGLGHATPHVMRRAFADFLQGAGGDIRLTQAMLGHARPSTTDAYLSGLSPEALSAGVRGLSLHPAIPVTFDAMAVPEIGESTVSPVEAPTGIEPVSGTSSVSERLLAEAWFADVALQAETQGAFYREALR